MISLAASTVIYTKIDLADVIEAQIRSSSQGAQLTTEQIETQVDGLKNSPFFPIMKWGGPLIGPPVLIFVVAALMLLLVYLMGSETTYKRLLGVTSHTYFFYYLVYSGLTVAVFLLASDPKSIDIQNPVYTNLGFLVEAKDGPVINKILSSLDIITIYIICLLGLGMSKVSERMKSGRGIVLVASIYIVYVLLGVGWRAIFG
jgi:hypothetical protein